MSKLHLILAALLTACLLQARADDVVVGTSANFEQVIRDNAFVVVEFYAPWCGHCRKLEPEYAKAAAELKANDPPITLMKIDAVEDQNKELASRYNIEGFPTLMIFRDGAVDAPQEYKGPRDASGIVNFLRKKLEPASTDIQSSGQLASFKQKDPAIVGWFDSEKDTHFKDVYLATAAKLADDYSFAHVFKSSNVGDASKAPVVRMFKPAEDKEVEYTGEWDATALSQWVEVTGAPLIIELDDNPRNTQAMQKAFASELPKFYSMLSKDEKEYKTFQTELRSAASSVAGQAWFINIEASVNERALGYFGIQASDLPAFIIQDEGGKYIKKNAGSTEAASFLKEYQAGKLEKTIKSEEPPADNSGPVTIVTGKTFESIAFSGKTVLLEFYAPWCGHCKKLEPAYDKVGEHFEKEKDVVIAKMDATANDVPSSKFDVKGFPSLYLVTKGGEVVTYGGDRSEQDLIKFVKDNSVVASSNASGEHTEL